MVKEEKGPQHPEEMRPDEDPVSMCCTASFGYPGWPDSDICSEWHEHSGIWEEE